MTSLQSAFIVEVRCAPKLDIIRCMLSLTLNGIRKAISAYENKQRDPYQKLVSSQEIRKLRPAAILMPLLEFQGRWHLLLTHRSEALVEHRGQVAFPGGAREYHDQDLAWTALREMHEEIGVNPHDVDVLGHLGDMPIITGYMVRPFVGIIPWPYPLRISNDEVESTFIIPLQWLIDPDHRTIRYRNFAGREFPVIYFDYYEGHQLWGFSAEMTLTLLSALDLVE